MKCSKCGAELSRKFCTVCGTPADAKPVCKNCGAELLGNFCTKCGTPANAENTVENVAVAEQKAPEAVAQTSAQEAPQQTEPTQHTPAQEAPQQAEPMQYNPVQYGQPQPSQQYTCTQSNTDFSQQYQNYSGGNAGNASGYTGQQFTNQPNNGATPNGKKSMSTGKIVALVLGIVGGVILLICILIGVAACNIINGAGNLVGEMMDDYNYDDYYDYYDYEFDYNDFMSNDNAQYNVENMITCGGEYWFAE